MLPIFANSLFTNHMRWDMSLNLNPVSEAKTLSRCPSVFSGSLSIFPGILYGTLCSSLKYPSSDLNSGKSLYGWWLDLHSPWVFVMRCENYQSRTREPPLLCFLVGCLVLLLRSCDQSIRHRQLKRDRYLFGSWFGSTESGLVWGILTK